MLNAAYFVMFVDQTKLSLHAGKGGNGIIAWIRRKYIPKGGPCGGDGGQGGHVYFETDSNMRSLEPYARRKKMAATHGQDGGASSRKGKNGTDLVIKVPCGTVIKDAHSGEVLLDLVEDKQKVLFLQGGKGGYGNERFKSSTERAPVRCTNGRLGQSKDVILELKLIADVGLVGFPNAGKSTLLTAISGARVKTASYPFTTLSPNLATIVKNYKHVSIADIPGIIEDAHKNRGLGLEFLRHIDRCSVLCFMIDIAGVDGRCPLEDYTILCRELSCFDEDLLKRKQIIILNKCDLEGSEENIELFLQAFGQKNRQILCASCLNAEGVDEIQNALYELVHGE